MPRYKIEAKTDVANYDFCVVFLLNDNTLLIL